MAVDNSKGAQSAGDVYVVDAANNAVDVFKPKPAGSRRSRRKAPSSRRLKGESSKNRTASLWMPRRARCTSPTAPKASSTSTALHGRLRKQADGGGLPERRRSAAPKAKKATSRRWRPKKAISLSPRPNATWSREFNAAGEWVGWITAGPPGPLGEPDGVALAPSGDVYVADAAGGAAGRLRPGRDRAGRQDQPGHEGRQNQRVPERDRQRRRQSGEIPLRVGPQRSLRLSARRRRRGHRRRKGHGRTDRTARGHDLPLPPGHRKRKRRERRGGPGIHDAAGGRRAEHRPGAEARAHRSDADGLADPERHRRPLLLRMGHEHALRRQARPSTDAGSGKEAGRAESELSGPHAEHDLPLPPGRRRTASAPPTGEDAHFTTSGPPRITSEPTTGITPRSGHDQRASRPG